MKKRFHQLAGICVMMTLLLSGCSEKAPESLLIEEIQTETLYLRADGTVQSSYVEDFDKSWYDTAELRTFMEEMIVEYNQTYGKNAVELTDLQVSGGKVYAILTYQNLAAYADFNANGREEGAELLAEEVSGEDAEDRYGAESFYQTKSYKSMVNGSEVLNTKKQNVVVIQGPVKVRTSGKIQYYTGGSLVDDTTLEIAEDVESVIIYKK